MIIKIHFPMITCKYTTDRQLVSPAFHDLQDEDEKYFVCSCDGFGFGEMF